MLRQCNIIDHTRRLWVPVVYPEEVGLRWECLLLFVELRHAINVARLIGREYNLLDNRVLAIILILPNPTVDAIKHPCHLACNLRIYVEDIADLLIITCCDGLDHLTGNDHVLSARVNVVDNRPDAMHGHRLLADKVASYHGHDV